jgi:hypothetical protein
MFVSARIPCVPSCFKCKLEIWSGPWALDFLMFLITCFVCSVVKGTNVVSSAKVSLRCSMCLSSLRSGRWLMSE